jgi:hypothetical protein
MNIIAQRLREAAQIAPFKVEKERYLEAAQEIERLQHLVNQVADASESMQLNVYEGDPWHADESDNSVRIFRGHLQIIKCAKHGTPYEEYWPDPQMLTWILQVLNHAESQSNSTLDT